MKTNLVLSIIVATLMAALIAACDTYIPANPFLAEESTPTEIKKPTVPLISAHPQDAVYTVGTQAIALTVTAETNDGGTLTYQWFRSEADSSGEGTAVDGATTASYTPLTDTTSTVYYYAKVINTIAGKTAAAPSDAARIEVNVKANAEVPLISGHPQDAVYTLGASPVALIVTTGVNDGGTLAYQWFRNTANNNTTGTLIPGANKSNYTPPTNTLSSTYYYVVITNTIPDNDDGGNKTAVAHSITAKITVNNKVNAEVPVITVQPQSAEYVVGSSPAPLTVEASVSDDRTLLYQWYSNDIDSNAGGTMIPGAYEKDYTPPPTNTIGAVYYYAVITNTIPNDGDGGNKAAAVHSDTAEITMVAPSDPLSLALSVSGSDVMLSPIDTADITVSIDGLFGLDMATVFCITPGITLAGSTLIYDGTATFATPSVTLQFSVNAGSNYITPLPASLSVTIYDGKANYTGTGNDRRIPVRQDNIAAFNAYANTVDGLARHFKLMEDIMLDDPAEDESNWTVIGTNVNRFTGSFNGQDKTISNLTINTTDDYQGMFGYSSGVVQNIGLTGGGVSGGDYVGGVVGYGTVQNCHSTGDVNGNDYVGGVVGYGTVQNCHSTGDVNGNDNVGGVVGRSSNTTVQNCHSTGDVNGNNYVGGVVGYGTPQNCYATGNVSGDGDYVGGVAGSGNSSSTMTNCYAIGSVSGNNNVGGVAGSNGSFGTVTNCYATGNVSGGGDHVGGVAGLNGAYGTVTNSYATGSVSGDGNYVGGVAGYNNSYSTMTNCYATGNVSGDGDYVGGVVGRNNWESTMTNCYATGSVSGNNYVGGVVSYPASDSKVENSVALNSSITIIADATAGIGRVIGYSGGIRNNNYARSTGMTLKYNNDVTYTPTSSSTGKDGANTSTYNTQAFWTGNAGWDFTNVWEWNSTTNLPILRNMPAGAQNHTVQ